MIPRPGLAVIRPVSTEDTLPGGRILLTDNTKDWLTRQQAELVNIGTEAEEDDYTWEDAEDNAWDEIKDLEAGRWLLLRHRTWIPTDTPDLFLVRHEDILAVLG